MSFLGGVLWAEFSAFKSKSPTSKTLKSAIFPAFISPSSKFSAFAAFRVAIKSKILASSLKSLKSLCISKFARISSSIERLMFELSPSVPKFTLILWRKAAFKSNVFRLKRRFENAQCVIKCKFLSKSANSSSFA